MQESCLAIEQLTKVLGRRTVVDHVSLQVRRGEIVGLLGPNGAGKTTSFYMIIGLLRPDRGCVVIDQQEVTYLPMHRRARLGLGYLPQEASIFRRMTVLENILAVLEAFPGNRQERMKEAERVLGELGLTALASSGALSLSGGERRRVEIARALVMRPHYLLLDEPFSGIDPIAVAELQTIIKTLAARGIGILITDHNVRETLSICDVGAIIYSGRIAEMGTTSQILASGVARQVYLGEQFQM